MNVPLPPSGSYSGYMLEQSNSFFNFDYRKQNFKAEILETPTEICDQFVVRFEIDNFEAFMIGSALFKSSFVTKRDLIRNNFNSKIFAKVYEKSNADSNSNIKILKLKREWTLRNTYKI